MLLCASASISRKRARGEGNPSSSISSMTRAAYFIIWSVSIPDSSEKSEGGAQRAAPLLLPAFLATGVTTTIAIPAPHAVGTTPRSTLTMRAVVDFDFEFRCVMSQKLSVVCHSETLGPRFKLQRMG